MGSAFYTGRGESLARYANGRHVIGPRPHQRAVDYDWRQVAEEEGPVDRLCDVERFDPPPPNRRPPRMLFTSKICHTRKTSEMKQLTRTIFPGTRYHPTRTSIPRFTISTAS